MSRPVATPMLSSMNARSSVATLPLAPGACGQPPMPASDRVEAVDADLERRADVGQREAARVVEVAAPEAVAGDARGPLEQLAHAARVGVADGVGEADAVGAGVQHRLHAGAAPRPARPGPASCSRRRCRCRPRCASSSRRRRAPRGSAPTSAIDLVGRLAQVGQAVRVARRQRHEHQVGSRGDRALGALQVRHQHRGDEARQRLRERDQLGGIGQLRQQPRAARTSRPRSSNT